MKRFVFVSLALLLFFSPPASCQPERIMIHFIDVDEGESILFETPSGETILIDSGNNITGLRVAEYLKKNGVESLDYFILTHPHADHIGGVFFIMQMLDVKRTFDNSQQLDDSNMLRWYSRLIRGHAAYAALKKGDTLHVDGIDFEVMWPAEPPTSANWNDNSLVMMMKFGKSRCLLTADVSTAVEEELLKDAPALRADVLKVGHHGYADATSEAFVAAVAPKISVIFAKEGSPYGELWETVPKRLADAGSRVYRTDTDGTIVLTVDNEGGIAIGGGR